MPDKLQIKSVSYFVVHQKQLIITFSAINVPLRLLRQLWIWRAAVSSWTVAASLVPVRLLMLDGVSAGGFGPGYWALLCFFPVPSLQMELICSTYFVMVLTETAACV